MERGSNIPHVAELAGTSLDRGAELDALVKLAPERQAELAEKAKAGEKVSAKAELKKAQRDKISPEQVRDDEPALSDQTQALTPNVSPVKKAEAALSIGSTEPAPPSDPHAIDRAAVRDGIRALGKLRDMDFSLVVASMPMEQLQEACLEAEAANCVLSAWFIALGDVLEPLALAEEDPSSDITDDLVSLEIIEQIPPIT